LKLVGGTLSSVTRQEQPRTGSLATGWPVRGTWAAPEAERVLTDVTQLLTATTPRAKTQRQATLTKDLAVLDAEGARADAAITKAIKALAMHATPPRPPG